MRNAASSFSLDRPIAVPFKTLGSLVTANRGGGTPSRSVPTYWGGSIPWASVGDLSGRSLTIESTRDSITSEGLDKSSSSLVRAGDVVIATKISPGRMKVAGLDIAINQDLRGLSLVPEIDARFLSYYFASERIVGHGSIVKAITNPQLEAIPVPVPPIELQRQIVTTLDSFDDLEVELEASLEIELKARQTQYWELRSRLFRGSRDPRAITLGNAASVRTGQAPREGSLRADGPYKFVNAGTAESGRTTEFNTPGATVTIPSRGQGGVGVVSFQADDFWCGPLCYRIRSELPELNTKFLYHYLKSIQPEIRSLQRTGGTPALNRKELILVKVPIPRTSEQERIVDALDEFDALVNDLRMNLPAELAARRKQYEYYRDKLLTFEEAPA